VRHLLAPLRELAPDEPTSSRGALAAWATAVCSASEACVLLDSNAAVAAASPAFADLIGVPLMELAGARLFETVLRVLDFNGGLPVPAEEVSRIPPLLALSAGALARSLLRVRRPDGACLTLDAVSSPLHTVSDGGVQGSVTFLHRI